MLRFEFYFENLKKLLTPINHFRFEQGDVLNTRDYVSVIAQSKALMMFSRLVNELKKPLHVILVYIKTFLRVPLISSTREKITGKS